MILARWKTAAYKGSSEPRRLAEIVKEIEVSTSLVTEEDFKPQKTGSKKGSTNGQTWGVNGSGANIKLLANKCPTTLLRRMRQGIRLDLVGWP